MQSSIHIGHHLLGQKEILTQYIHGRQVLIVTQSSIAQFYLEKLQQNLKDYHCDVFMLPEGEQYKTVQQWQKMLDTFSRMLQNPLH